MVQWLECRQHKLGTLGSNLAATGISLSFIYLIICFYFPTVAQYCTAFRECLNNNYDIRLRYTEIWMDSICPDTNKKVKVSHCMG